VNIGTVAALAGEKPRRVRGAAPHELHDWDRRGPLDARCPRTSVSAHRPGTKRMVHAHGGAVLERPSTEGGRAVQQFRRDRADQHASAGRLCRDKEPWVRRILIWSAWVCLGGGNMMVDDGNPFGPSQRAQDGDETGSPETGSGGAGEGEETSDEPADAESSDSMNAGSTTGAGGSTGWGGSSTSDTTWGTSTAGTTSTSGGGTTS